MVACLDLGWCPVAEVFVQAFAVPPGDPLEGRLFQRLHAFERLAAADQLGLVRAVEVLRQRVVVRVADRAGGRQDRALSPEREIAVKVGEGLILGTTVPF